MQKLIELLNEYEYSRFEDKSLATQRLDIQDRIVFEKDFCQDLDKPKDQTMNVTHLISHRFGFIKWLVDNDKIDRDKELKENGLFRKYFYDLEYVKNYDRLVMWLSVEDEPIEFLISILK